MLDLLDRVNSKARFIAVLNTSCSAKIVGQADLYLRGNMIAGGAFYSLVTDSRNRKRLAAFFLDSLYYELIQFNEASDVVWQMVQWVVFKVQLCP